ncbi:hypothetical protein COU58_04325 [Candidatus Pacearchaeota archaeon CG10_big_fil_rev_8_21_14_0_10_32_42]|nr:MAG: hypothetical protein COU58_04325 [Candidatus Pacearchaeota archaeon CG10_big_fil_rev_8_21_14_0_10_32_42]
MGMLKDMGFNTKEKIYCYGGGIVGAIAPIVAARYTFFNDFKDSLEGEAISWGASVLLNLSSMILPPHLPVPVYTSIFGMMAGEIGALNSRTKRTKKEKNLESITKE